MRNLKEHGEIIQKFITEVLLRDEKQKSMFSWTEAKMYAELQTFLDFQPLKPAHFKTLATGIRSTESSISCGQKPTGLFEDFLNQILQHLIA